MLALNFLGGNKLKNLLIHRDDKDKRKFLNIYFSGSGTNTGDGDSQPTLFLK